MNAKKGFFIGLLFAFFVLGFISLERAIPDAKEERIYNAIKPYMPYKIEKRLGGLTIIDNRDGRKEKPDAASFYHRLDELEKEWGKEHLRVLNNDVVILGDNNQSIVKIFIETKRERDWLHNYFGI